MSNVYIEARPRAPIESAGIEHFVVEGQRGDLLQTFSTLRQAVHWARDNGHAPLVPYDEERNDKAQREQWRSAYGIVLV